MRRGCRNRTPLRITGPAHVSSPGSKAGLSAQSGPWQAGVRRRPQPVCSPRKIFGCRLVSVSRAGQAWTLGCRGNGFWSLHRPGAPPCHPESAWPGAVRVHSPCPGGRERTRSTAGCCGLRLGIGTRRPCGLRHLAPWARVSGRWPVKRQSRREDTAVLAVVRVAQLSGCYQGHPEPPPQLGGILNPKGHPRQSLHPADSALMTLGSRLAGNRPPLLPPPTLACPDSLAWLRPSHSVDVLPSGPSQQWGLQEYCPA